MAECSRILTKLWLRRRAGVAGLRAATGRSRRLLAGPLLGLLLVAVAAPGALARPAYFLADPITGYAIGGFDPVAFFVDGRPRMGETRLEYMWKGARWLFVNEGNRAAFEKAPEVYAPQFTGCGAYALAEGYATAGNPAIFAILDNRLYFFHTQVNRFLFLVEFETALADAQANAAKTGCVPRP
ncbi:YHS domain-containing (seleno)protein [Pannonibacter tanglangensis]|uniref:YHS domain-containing (seleno)protein n=1 Tax=Pannonibacter tanglangensis TaxID=2750084 RepID=UPI001AD92991|nr:MULTISPECIES: YHS domain-containing (seleno)protein [unclassified Pannonibacter]